MTFPVSESIDGTVSISLFMAGSLVYFRDNVIFLRSQLGRLRVACLAKLFSKRSLVPSQLWKEDSDVSAT